MKEKQTPHTESDLPPEKEEVQEQLSQEELNEQIFEKNIHHFEHVAQLITQALESDPETKINFNWIKKQYTSILRPINEIRSEDGSIDWDFIVNKLQLCTSNIDATINIKKNFQYKERKERDTENLIKEVQDIFKEMDPQEHSTIDLPNFLQEKDYALYDAITRYFRNPSTKVIEWKRLVFAIEAGNPQWKDKITFRKVGSKGWNKSEKHYANSKEFIDDVIKLLEKENPESFYQNYIYTNLMNAQYLLSKENKTFSDVVAALPEKWKKRFKSRKKEEVEMHQNKEEELNEQIFKKNIHHFERLSQLILQALESDPETKINFNWIKKQYTSILKPISKIRKEDGSLDWDFIINKLQTIIDSTNPDISLKYIFTYKERKERGIEQLIKEVQDIFKEMNPQEHSTIYLPNFLQEKNYALYDAITRYFRNPSTKVIEWKRLVFAIEAKNPQWEDKITFIKVGSKGWNKSEKHYANSKEFIDDVIKLLEKENPDSFDQNYIYTNLMNAHHLLSKENKTFSDVIAALPEKWKERFKSRKKEEVEMYQNKEEVQGIYDNYGFSGKEHLLLLPKKDIDGLENGKELYELSNIVIDELAKLSKQGNEDSLHILLEYLPTSLRETIIDHKEYKKYFYALTEEILKKMIQKAISKWEGEGHFLHYVLAFIPYAIKKHRGESSFDINTL